MADEPTLIVYFGSEAELNAYATGVKACAVEAEADTESQHEARADLRHNAIGLARLYGFRHELPPKQVAPAVMVRDLARRCLDGGHRRAGRRETATAAHGPPGRPADDDPRPRPSRLARLVRVVRRQP